jgi:hypothetical protein
MLEVQFVLTTVCCDFKNSKNTKNYKITVDIEQAIFFLGTEIDPIFRPSQTYAITPCFIHTVISNN